jgi:hypothetical protein
LDVLLEVSDDFDLTADQIAFAWNSKSSHTALAVARARTERVDDFDGGLVGAVVVVLGSLASGVAGNALYDLLKEILHLSGDDQEISYTEIDKPDGTKIVQARLSKKK